MTSLDKRAYESLVREQDRLMGKMLDILIFAKGMIPPQLSQADADERLTIEVSAAGLFRLKQMIRQYDEEKK